MERRYDARPMAVTSNMLPLGTTMPSFELPDARTGETVSSSSLRGPKGVLVLFVCNHCPYVVHIRAELVRAAHEAMDAGLSVVAINSNSTTTHEEDGPAHMKDMAVREGWRFPFLFDESQDVARAFDAACTPDLYVFDAARRLAYRGQFDDARPKNTVPVSGRDLRAAIAAVAVGQAPAADQKPSMAATSSGTLSRGGAGGSPRGAPGRPAWRTRPRDSAPCRPEEVSAAAAGPSSPR